MKPINRYFRLPINFISSILRSRENKNRINDKRPERVQQEKMIKKTALQAMRCEKRLAAARADGIKMVEVKKPKKTRLFGRTIGKIWVDEAK